MYGEARTYEINYLALVRTVRNVDKAQSMYEHK